MNVLQTSWNIQGSYASECEDFWNVTPCNLVGRYEHFTGFSCLHLQDRKVQSSPFICWFFSGSWSKFSLSTTVIYIFFTLGLLFYPEDVSNSLPDYIPEDSNLHTCHISFSKKTLHHQISRIWMKNLTVWGYTTLSSPFHVLKSMYNWILIYWAASLRNILSALTNLAFNSSSWSV
jgi:hypothetical protein